MLHMADSDTKREGLRARGGTDEGLAFAVGAARVAAENKSDDVIVLDLRGLSSLADFFVVGTGTSARQMHAVMDRIEDYGRSIGQRPFKVSDSAKSAWILADYVDVVIHLFDNEHRSYYDLDGLWGDAPRIDWRQPPPAAAPRGDA